jgi:lysophospholipase L1-like esterase
LLATLAFCLAAVCAHATERPTKIMLLGDSLTAQGEGRWPLHERLAKEGYSFEFVGSMGEAPLRHEGHNGFTIGPDQSQPGNLSDNVETWIRAARPDVIFLLVGNNDFNGKPGVDPAGAPERLTALLEKITSLAPDAEVIVSTGLKIAIAEDYAGALNRRIPGIVSHLKEKGLRVHLADLNTEVSLIKGAPPFNGPDGDYADGTHMNKSGGQKVADARYVHLVPFLKKGS